MSWRIASVRLARRRSKRKSSICSTRLRGKEIVVTRAGGRLAFQTWPLCPCGALPARFSAWRRYHVRRDIWSLSQGFLASRILRIL